jgi:hypothetical protein
VRGLVGRGAATGLTASDFEEFCAVVVVDLIPGHPDALRPVPRENEHSVVFDNLVHFLVSVAEDRCETLGLGFDPIFAQRVRFHDARIGRNSRD